MRKEGTDSQGYQGRPGRKERNPLKGKHEQTHKDIKVGLEGKKGHMCKEYILFY